MKKNSLLIMLFAFCGVFVDVHGHPTGGGLLSRLTLALCCVQTQNFPLSLPSVMVSHLSLILMMESFLIPIERQPN
ncbi:MAG: hypothetical protein QG632_682 [Candidatus Dependentiae bacterium]|nr:hypothetical protein [Candidatus Dependentiae bacterium]